MKARLYDVWGLHVANVRDVGRRPPEVLQVSDREEWLERTRPRDFAEPLQTFNSCSPVIRRGYFEGVEVDRHGTWARYVEHTDPVKVEPETPRSLEDGLIDVFRTVARNRDQHAGDATYCTICGAVYSFGTRYAATMPCGHSMADLRWRETKR